MALPSSLSGVQELGPSPIGGLAVDVICSRFPAALAGAAKEEEKRLT